MRHYDARKRIDRRPAATLVETAMVISIFLMVLFGIFEYGRFVMTRQLMENAAREGARWAIANTYNGTTAQLRDVVDARLGVARNQLVGYTKATAISAYAADINGNAIAGKAWNDAAFGENVVVEVVGQYAPVLPNLLRLNTSFTVRSKAIMMSEAN
jgi:Flp pilus assembly protein TadG